MKKSWLRSSNWTWYVELNGRQIKPGKDPRYEGKNPPATKPRNPPEELLAKWRALNLKSQPKEDLTLASLIETYLRDHQSTNKRVQYGKALIVRSFLKHAGDVRVSSLRPHHLSAWLKVNPQWGMTTICTYTDKIRNMLG